MMKLLIAIALAFALSDDVLGIRCPEDNGGASFTGHTRTNISGRLMKEYKCYRYGHRFWVASSNQP